MTRLTVRLALAVYVALAGQPGLWNRPVASWAYVRLASFIGDHVALLTPRERQAFQRDLFFHRMERSND